MTSYSETGPLVRSLVCFWAILLILGFSLNTVISVRQKRYLSAVKESVFGFPIYFFMQVCRDISCRKMGKISHNATESFGLIPLWIYIIFLLLFTFVFTVQFYSLSVYSRRHITPSSVKEAVDKNPTGICCYRTNGQPVLTNQRMNAVAFEMTGRTLLNGAEFYEKVRENRIADLSDGTVVRFSRTVFTLDGEDFYELTADDITELYRKSQTLRKENDILKSQNQRMIDYGKTIDENIRRQEILNTKTSIHDEMNRLLLSTENIIQNGTDEEKHKILETWQNNILLLCMEADSVAGNNVISDLNELAVIMGLNVCCDRIPKTDDKELLYLFFLAAEEAMTNSVKHAGARNLYIHIDEDDKFLTAVFTNDGKKPLKKISEGGGLLNLRHRIETSGGSLTAVSGEQFILTVSLVKGGKCNAMECSYS